MEIGFAPIADEDAHSLILGSMPSVKSLEQQQYYAHPRNAFWPIMSALFDIEKDGNYQQRCQQLMKNNVAVWDALKACQRQGSLDSNIESNSMVANDFNFFLQQHPKIEKILFNGGKAEQVFKQHVLPTLDEQFKQLSQTLLPSTSPAHASMTFERKQAVWKKSLIC